MTDCQAFAPILYSVLDTPDTTLSIIQHNAVWDALCKKAPRP